MVDGTRAVIVRSGEGMRIEGSVGGTLAFKVRGGSGREAQRTLSAQRGSSDRRPPRFVPVPSVSFRP